MEPNAGFDFTNLRPRPELRSRVCCLTNWATQILHGKSFIFFNLFIFKDFILFIHERQREREREAETRAEKKEAPRWEPNVGLDPGTPGSCPGPKAGAKTTGPPRNPHGKSCILFYFFPHGKSFKSQFFLFLLIVLFQGIPGWLSGLAPACSPGHQHCLHPRMWSWSPGIRSHIRLPAWSLLLTLPVSLLLSLSLSLALMNK